MTLRPFLFAMVLVWAAGFCVGSAHADFFDSFDDGWWQRDPNDPRYDANDPYWTDPNNAVLWDKDNPDWYIGSPVPGAPSSVQVITDSVCETSLWLWADKHFLIPMGATGVWVDSGDKDPNTSCTWWDDTTDHYVLTWVYYTGYYDPNDHNGYGDPNYDPNDDDPNDDMGSALVLLHLDDANWTGFAFEFMFAKWYHPTYPQMQPVHMALKSLLGADAATLRDIWIDPNHPGWANYPDIPDNVSTDPVMIHPTPADYNGPDYGGVDFDPWERMGFWMLIQFEQDPNHAPGDPNGKVLRAACWPGDKYDWDGKWLMEGDLAWLWNVGDSGGSLDPNGDFYWPAGGVGLVSTSDIARGNGYPSQAAFDNVEARTGIFDPGAKTLDLSVVNGHYGRIVVDPVWPDPNDPNTPDNRLVRYTPGTDVVLVAEVTADGKSFKEWRIWDPNYPGDHNYAVIDTNAVLSLVMDTDYQIEAAFQCGSGVPPFLMMGLAAMGVLALLRLRG